MKKWTTKKKKRGMKTRTRSERIKTLRRPKEPLPTALFDWNGRSLRPS